MRKFIIGTDWWTDCDDAVAMRLAARAHNSGKIEILGVAINACMEHSAKSLSAFLALEGVDDIPVGIDLAGDDFGGKPPYQKRLAEYPAGYKCNSDAEDAVRLYRRLLAAADGPVEIAEIGFLQVVSALLESRPDDISPETGLELVRRKVSHMWVMAGKWDEAHGVENNFARNARARAASSAFCEKCPVPVTFLGWEVGASVITGGKLAQEDHLHAVLEDFGMPQGRSSWDPMLMLLAITGDERAAGYDVVRGSAAVDADTGANSFTEAPDGLHCYVVKMRPDEYYQNLIDGLIK